MRIFCISCPPACHMRNMQRPAEACMEAMWNDGRCDPNCNSIECDFNDCSPAQTASQCVHAQVEMGLDLSTAPDDSSVAMSLVLSAPSIGMSASLNKMVYKSTISYQVTSRGLEPSWAQARRLAHALLQAALLQASYASKELCSLLLAHHLLATALCSLWLHGYSHSDTRSD